MSIILSGFSAAKILPSTAINYIFYSSSENKNVLSRGKNIGFYHVFYESDFCRNVTQQKKEIRSRGGRDRRWQMN
jgi:hypothetical protein